MFRQQALKLFMHQAATCSDAGQGYISGAVLTHEQLTTSMLLTHSRAHWLGRASDEGTGRQRCAVGSGGDGRAGRHLPREDDRDRGSLCRRRRNGPVGAHSRGIPSEASGRQHRRRAERAGRRRVERHRQGPEGRGRRPHADDRGAASDRASAALRRDHLYHRRRGFPGPDGPEPPGRAGLQGRALQDLRGIHGPCPRQSRRDADRQLGGGRGEPPVLRGLWQGHRHQL